MAIIAFMVGRCSVIDEPSRDVELPAQSLAVMPKDAEPPWLEPEMPMTAYAPPVAQTESADEPPNDTYFVIAQLPAPPEPRQFASGIRAMLLGLTEAAIE